MDAGRRHRTLKSETKNLITHGKSSSLNLMLSGINFPYLKVPQVWHKGFVMDAWTCSGLCYGRETQLGWSSAYIVSLHFVWGETLPHPSWLFTANTTLSTGLDQDWAELYVTGAPSGNRQGHQGPWWIASSYKYACDWSPYT